MNKKTQYALLIFFYVAIFSVFSNPVLIPREVFVGDTAELSFSIDTVFSMLSGTKKNERLQVDSLIKDSNEYTIESIVLLSKEHGTGVSIIFIPWKTGNLELPPFYYEQVEIVPPQIHVASILEKLDKKDLAPIRAPLLIPGTTWLVYGFVVFSCFILLTLYVIFKRKKNASSLRGINRRVLKYAKQRQRFVKKHCKFLEKKIEKMSTIEWFTLCNKSVKQYCAHFCTLDFTAYTSYTTTDILNDFSKCDIENCALHTKDLARLFTEVDAKRFGAREEFDVEKRTALVCDFRKIVESLEKSGFIPYSYRRKGS